VLPGGSRSSSAPALRRCASSCTRARSRRGVVTCTSFPRRHGSGREHLPDRCRSSARRQFCWRRREPRLSTLLDKSS
jgi:hypothetical protein